MHEEFSRSNFEESQVWGSYYEPDDIDDIVEMGFSREEVTRELEKVNWSDSYCFPIAENTKIGSFMYEYRKAVFTTESGKVFSGYVVNRGHAIRLFGAKKEWRININLFDLIQVEMEELKVDLELNNAEELFPLNVRIPYINHEFIFAKNN